MIFNFHSRNYFNKDNVLLHFELACVFLLEIYIIFVIIWVTGIAGMIISPLISLTYEGIMGAISSISKTYMII